MSNYTVLEHYSIIAVGVLGILIVLAIALWLTNVVFEAFLRLCNATWSVAEYLYYRREFKEWKRRRERR